MAGQSKNGIAYQPYVQAAPSPRRVRRRRRRLLRHRLLLAFTVCGAVVALGGAALTSILKMLYPGI